MGLMPYAASVTPNQPAHLGILVRRNTVSYKIMQGFVVSLADKITPDQMVQLRKLVWTYIT
ncbi:hypothetical protein DPMN_115107 [Dreissena polymorpha]|uniref:Uncharacterized protein n=1 Tax=Dreissena polymorpha TaxID=45954 RepID=A0A9D4QSC3_DREPO|nr:hypothetical protein DPMN_115107 [Dreissena polymorpha]